MRTCERWRQHPGIRCARLSDCETDGKRRLWNDLWTLQKIRLHACRKRDHAGDYLGDEWWHGNDPNVGFQPAAVTYTAKREGKSLSDENGGIEASGRKKRLTERRWGNFPTSCREVRSFRYHWTGNREERASGPERYLRLNSLILEIQDLVDDKKIAFNPAVELSYLSTEEQKEFIQAIEEAQPLHRFRRHSGWRKSVRKEGTRWMLYAVWWMKRKRVRWTCWFWMEMSSFRTMGVSSWLTLCQSINTLRFQRKVFNLLLQFTSTLKL